MNIRKKLNIVLFFTFLFALSISSYYLKVSLDNNALNELKSLSNLQMDMAQATRKYTSEHIKGLISNEQSFNQETVPSFAASTVMSNLNSKYEKTTYSEVALNPTNPKNKAQPWQVKIIKEFDENPQLNEIFRITRRGDVEYMNFLKPLRVTNQTCLNCHSNPSIAPVSMIKKYGDQNGFNWKLNETVGAQIVSIPTEVAMKNAQLSLFGYIGGTCLICAIFFMVLNMMLNHVVINPIESSNKELHVISRQDALTGILNRRAFDEALFHFMTYRKEFALVSMDIDFFKKINDEHGHVIGDSVLREFAIRVGGVCQNRYFFSRIGGEEFALIILQKNSLEAESIAQAIKTVVTSNPFEHVGNVTTSFGITQYHPEDTASVIMGRVDAALYKAKQNGRNRIEVVLPEKLQKLKIAA